MLSWLCGCVFVSVVCSCPWCVCVFMFTNMFYVPSFLCIIVLFDFAFALAFSLAFSLAFAYLCAHVFLFACVCGI